MIERVDHCGIMGAGTSFSVERTSVRDLAGVTADGVGGMGIAVQDQLSEFPRGVLSLQASTIVRARTAGVAVFGSDVAIGSTIVRHMLPTERPIGTALYVVASMTGRRSAGTVDRTSIQGAVLTGLRASDSDVVVTATAIDGVASVGDQFGDGICSESVDMTSSVEIRDTVISRSARAGISSFAGDVQMAGVRLNCNPIQLNSEPGATGLGFHDEGDNWCGCDHAAGTCQILSSSLEPPPMLPPL
ncbi:MAG: hypothetical protein DRI90_11295 [Deltaproteobacteria bacterium]|nr:MAG: hypothetical protein DRI90_11295 [Deltaproteobacteria bacterium]